MLLGALKTVEVGDKDLSEIQFKNSPMAFALPLSTSTSMAFHTSGYARDKA